MSEKYKKVYRSLNYFARFLVFVSGVSGCVSIFAVTLTVGIAIGIASSIVIYFKLVLFFGN